MKIFTDLKVMEFLISKTENVSLTNLKISKTEISRKPLGFLNKIFRNCVDGGLTYSCQIWVGNMNALKVINFIGKKT